MSNFVKIIMLFYFLIAIIVNKVKSENQCDPGWTQYGDEFCYQVVEKTVNWQQAKELCEDLDNSTLAMIKSKEEQDFIEDFLYKQKHVVDNVWIGGHRSDGNSEFRWVDGTKLDYKHWRKENPFPDDSSNCIQLTSTLNNQNMTTNGGKKGEWSNTDCEKHNFVTLCQKAQKLNFSKLTKIVIELKQQFESEKKVLKDTIAQMQATENDLKSNIKELNEETQVLNKTVINQEKQLNQIEDDFSEKFKELIKKIDNSRSVIPLNFVYVQYPHEKEPSILFNCSHGRWVDISNTYANLFFRVNGGQSNFGSVQDENLPAIDEITRCAGSGCTRLSSVNIVKGGWSDSLETANTATDKGGYYFSIKFHNKGGEVRPRNMAIKLWKCQV